METTEYFSELASEKSFFNMQHENLLASSWHAVHIMEEERAEPNWMIAQLLPELLQQLHAHCMLEEDFMILARYPDYFWHEKEHRALLHAWKSCGKKELARSEKSHLIRQSAQELARHIASTDKYLRHFAGKKHYPDEISLLKMHGIRFPCSGLFPNKEKG